MIESLATSREALFCVAGLFGMLAHYVKKWGRGQYLGSLWQYLVSDNPRASLAAVMTYAGAVAGVLATGMLESMDLVPAIALGFTTGYTVDSAVNSTTQRAK